MNKIVIWIGAGIGLFVVLVGITFAVLLSSSPDEEMLIVEHSAASPQVESQVLKIKQAEVDTLRAQLLDAKSQNFFTKGKVDSLMQQTTLKDGLMAGYQKEIEQLKGIVLKKEKQAISMKELAKTYQSMKTSEMKPLLANVDDKTVISIYRNVSAKSRKSVLLSLDNKRAAKITEILAGTR